MNQALGELKQEFHKINAKELSNVDLTTFISYLMLCDPTITQAKIAKILDITPVALSRSLNSVSGDFKFKEEWSEKLLDAFAYIDLDKARDNWNNLLQLVNHLERRNTYLALADLMIQHLYSDGYCFNPKSYTLSPNHLLFERGDEKWVFFIQHQKLIPSSARTIWPYPRCTELENARQYSIICLSYNAYNSYIKPKFLPANLAAWESNFKTISALLISKDLDSIEQETILYDREKGIDFPEIE